MIPRTIAAALLLLMWSAPAAAQVTVATDVTDDALSWNSQPKLARGRDGTIYLTFVKRAGGVSQIFLASSTDGKNFRLQQVTREAGDSRFPSLAIGQDGFVHLTWTQYKDPVGKVYYARLEGNRWSTPIKLSAGTVYAGVPAIAVDLQQQPHVVWYGIRPNAPPVLTRHGSIYEILYRGHGRGRWSDPEFISPGIPDSINPGLAVDGRGALHSAWYQSDMRTYHVRHAQRVTAWENPQTLTAGSGDAFAVALAAGPDDAVYVVWEQKSAGSEIYFSERHARWSAPHAVSSGSSAAHPTVTVDTTGRVYVAWDSDGTIYVRRKADRWQGIERLTRGDGKHSHPILSTRNAAVDIVWVESRGAQRALRFSSLAGASPSTRRLPSAAMGIAIVLALIGLALVVRPYLARRMR